MSKIIRVTGLTKTFGKLIAVDNISFSVNEAEIFAFLGPNGAGKSTTIKMLTTLLQPTSGKIEVCGFNPKFDSDKVRRSLGIVFQDSSLDEELTAQENMTFHGVLYDVPRNELQDKIEILLKIVELWDRRNDLVKHFSGGMRRRLEIARGLLHHPKILFLDEPTVGLDPQTRQHIWTYIKELNKTERITIFYTTHYLEEAEKIASRIAIIDHGKIIAEGTALDLKKKTKTNSLEEAFISLTGKAIREEEASGIDHMRSMRKAWRR